MTAGPRALKLEPRIQHYAWGDPAFIPDLLGRPRDGRPWAEAWYGAHPSAPSTVHTAAGPKSLDAYLSMEATRLLGSEVAGNFGTLPYLVKLLAAARPLSIQVHPDAAQARAGFDREQAAGIPLDAPHRNYRDRQHKPELIVALTPFHALCGFRALDDIASRLADLPELSDLLPGEFKDHESLDVLLAAWFALPDAKVRLALDRLLARLTQQQPEISTPEFWLLQAQAALGPQAPADRGLLFLFLLELRELRPGQALFLDAGIPHAYLRGAGIEVMAASDNVLRAGLTPKHVDVPELMEQIRFAARRPPVLRPEPVSAVEAVFATPAEEFRLSEVRPGPEPTILTARAAEILLGLEGEARLRVPDAGREIPLPRGATLLVPAAVGRYAVSGSGCFFRATTPVS